jgi:hypothetical protein
VIGEVQYTDNFIELDHIGVIERFHEVNFSHDAIEIGLIFDTSFIQNLDSNLTRQNGNRNRRISQKSQEDTPVRW